MFVDASALVAILLDEADAARLSTKLGQYAERSTSPLAVWETVVALCRERRLPVKDASAMIHDYLSEADIAIVAVEPEMTSIALTAFDRYGKGRHPAALNFGDCFAYACAKHLKMPLLYKGDDFALTDIRAA